MKKYFENDSRCFKFIILTFLRVIKKFKQDYITIFDQPNRYTDAIFHIFCEYQSVLSITQYNVNILRNCLEV